MLIRASVLVSMMVLSASARAQRPDTATTKAALMAADRALAARVETAGPRAFLAALEADAAVLFPGRPILRGAARSQRPFLARYDRPSSYTWSPVHAVASTDGQFGCTVGFSRFTNAADTSHSQKRGTYLTCWRRDAGGDWRIAGHERNDSPGRPPVLADGSTISFAPHSATVSLGGPGVRATQEADAAFARLGSEADGPGPAFVRYAATDAVVLSGARFPHGLTEIAAAFDGFPADQIIRWNPMRSFGAGSGGLTYTVGHSSSGPRVATAGKTQLNKYMTVWRQNPDGRWVYIFDLGTSR